MSPRRCYVILPEQRNDRGYIPSIVTEGEPGHAPLMGRGEFSQPWYWGTDLAAATRLCAEFNRKDFGLDGPECSAIVSSSVMASIRMDAAAERYRRLVPEDTTEDSPLESLLRGILGGILGGE
jgi:hypothetical protein